MRRGGRHAGTPKQAHFSRSQAMSSGPECSLARDPNHGTVTSSDSAGQRMVAQGRIELPTP